MEKNYERFNAASTTSCQVSSSSIVWAMLHVCVAFFILLFCVVYWMKGMDIIGCTRGLNENLKSWSVSLLQSWFYCSLYFCQADQGKILILLSWITVSAEVLDAHSQKFFKTPLSLGVVSGFFLIETDENVLISMSKWVVGQNDLLKVTVTSSSNVI